MLRVPYHPFLLFLFFLLAGAAGQCPLSFSNGPTLPPTDTSCSTNCITISAGGGRTIPRYFQSIITSGGTSPYTPTLIGSLPNGLTYSVSGSSSENITISGRANQTGDFSFQICANDASGTCSAICATYTLSVTCGAMVWSSSGLVARPRSSLVLEFDVLWGNPSAVTFSNEPWGGTRPFSFTISSGVLPAGVSFAAGSVSGKQGYTLLFTGTPTQLGDFPVRFLGTDAIGCATSNDITLRICTTDLALLPPSATAYAPAGQAFSLLLSGAGGVAPYSLNVTVGTLPVGLSLDASTGVISGTPTTIGSSSFRVDVTDLLGCTAYANYNIQIVCSATFDILPHTLPPGDSVTAYSTQLTTTGGTGQIRWAASGNLPGVGVNALSGTIVGTPTVGGAPFIISATDANNCVAQRQFALPVDCGAPTFTPGAFSNGTVGSSYNAFLSLSTGSTSFNVYLFQGELPPGLTLSGTGGGSRTISGTPLASGTYAFTLQVVPTSSSSWCEWYFDRVIVVMCSTGNSAVLNVDPPIMPAAHVGVPYSATFTVSGGTPPYSIGTFTNSPYNLTWSTPTANNVTLYGTPNATTGSYGDDSVSAQDATGCQTSRVWREIVCDPTQISLTPTTFVWYVGSDNGNTTTPTLSGSADKLDVVVSGNVPGQFTWRLLSNMLQFLGSPNQLGAFSFGVTVTHLRSGSISTTVGCTASATFTIQAVCAPFVVNPTSISSLNIGAPFSVTFGTEMYFGFNPVIRPVYPLTAAVTAGALPSGLTLNSSTLLLSGTPTQAGLFNYTITLTDALGCTASANFSQLASCISTSISSNTPRVGVEGLSYNFTLISASLNPITSLTVNSSSLPAGLFTAGNAILGTPTASGTFTFQLQATYAAGCTSQVQSYSIRICSTATINVQTLPTYTAGQAYSVSLSMTGFTAPLSWFASGLPSWLTFNGTTGVMSGLVPSPAPTTGFAITVTAIDATGCYAVFPYVLSKPCSAISAVSSVLPPACVGTYSYGLSALISDTVQHPSPFYFTNLVGPTWLSITTNGQLTGAVPSPLPPPASISVLVADANLCSNRLNFTLPTAVFCTTAPPTTIASTAGSAATTASGSSSSTSASLALSPLSCLVLVMCIVFCNELTG